MFVLKGRERVSELYKVDIFWFWRSHTTGIICHPVDTLLRAWQLANSFVFYPVVALTHSVHLSHLNHCLPSYQAWTHFISSFKSNIANNHSISTVFLLLNGNGNIDSGVQSQSVQADVLSGLMERSGGLSTVLHTVLKVRGREALWKPKA